jgi:F-type H+-transporting ATPase subunit epsilon
MLQCEIVTPESKLYSDEVNFVVIPASEGEMGIYAQHEPVVTTLKSGTVRVTEQEGKESLRFIVAGGYAQIEAERVIVLADRAAALQELDETAIKVHIDDLKEKMADLKDDDPNRAFINDEVKWNQVLLEQTRH